MRLFLCIYIRVLCWGIFSCGPCFYHSADLTAVTLIKAHRGKFWLKDEAVWANSFCQVSAAKTSKCIKEKGKGKGALSH